MDYILTIKHVIRAPDDAAARHTAHDFCVKHGIPLRKEGSPESPTVKLQELPKGQTPRKVEI